jgi:hypothetical protein
VRQIGACLQKHHGVWQIRWPSSETPHSVTHIGCMSLETPQLSYCSLNHKRGENSRILTNELTEYLTNQGYPINKQNKQTPWSESASELYRQSDRRLSAKWLSTFADRGCHVVSVTDPYGRILGFLDRSRYISIKLLLSCTHEAEWTPFQAHYFFFWQCRESNPGLRICSQELWPLDHRGGQGYPILSLSSSG